MTTTGMLWLNTDKRPLADDIARACAYYQQRHGRQAALCLVPLQPAPLPTVPGLQIRPARYVMAGHIILFPAEALKEEN